MEKLVVHQLLKHTLNIHPENEIVSGDTRFTYASLYSRVTRLANSLSKLGVGRGTVAGVLDANTHRYLELHYALSMLGAVVHTINFRLASEDLLYTMKHAGDQWIFVSDLFIDALKPMAGAFPNWVIMGDNPGVSLEGAQNVYNYEDLVTSGTGDEPAQAGQVEETDIFSIFYTTGTTGMPKGIRYRHRDVLLGSLQILHHLAIHTTGGNINSSDVFMPLIPFFHIHAWGTAFFVPYLGAKLVLPGRATPAEQARLIKEEKVTWMNMVSTQMHMLLEHPEFNNVKVLTGGSPMPTGLAEKAARSGINFSLIYGGSDQLSTAISVIPEGVDPRSEEAHNILRTRMRPLPMVEVSIRDREGKEVARDGETLGEVWVKSPWLPGEYYKEPEKSRESFHGPWFKTGDIGVYYPDGSIYVADRLGDAIKSGGEWIPTGTLEAIISEHPVVEQVAVIATPDERWSERPLAVVKAASSLTTEELKAFLATKVAEGKIAKFWIPDEFTFIDEMPLTSAGKISKVRLRSKYGK